MCPSIARSTMMRFCLLLAIALPAVAKSDSGTTPMFHRPPLSLTRRFFPTRQSALLSLRGGTNAIGDTGTHIHGTIQEDDSFVEEFRGGGAHKTKEPEASTAAAPKLIVSEKVIAGTFALLVASVLLYHNWESVKPFLDKAYIQEHTLTILKDLESNPMSLPIYAGGMALWELVGLSTIPVETAAGMVFGFHRAFLASGVGKLLGASAAFGLGRGLLSSFVQKQLQQNPVWNVVNRSTDVHSPLVVALLMKFSCFPELIKNFGSSCLMHLSYSNFLGATMFHGLTFTLLWTMLGVDAAARLENPNLPANVPLQIVLVLAAMIGLVGSPLLMAWWVRDMRKIAGLEETKE
ncbi:expressed unknown protein [Seminavis robusta]|uniref:VTT domain-containing protein n=1 Tax=Seminavis robusta TaxID=568900 RepID=A0A9N8HLP5_9STRA|nr:expressed unknown protein [Seminavis robusta]|eukprot:Sro840_g209390.1 n/a (349) ;mRNA; f:17515-18561